MDEFESALEGEVDPAAEFLAREQSELEELGIEDQLGIPVSQDVGDFTDTAPSQQEDTFVNGFGDDIPSGTFAEIQPSSVQAQEPESLRKWREDKAVLLDDMQEEETNEQEKWAEKAKKELDDWYNRYNEQLEKVKNENRAAQEEFIEEMSSTKPGNEWTKVARLCDFNPKVNKNTKDVSRMRSILLRLKQEPLVR
ncbi:clathrin light chain B-like [Rhopilema esculentum]|uniref:clathrin light chain B-like n=1 Tax=Rhopilema esculentum TaxID=499914 RepID=UPI0031E1F1D9